MRILGRLSVVGERRSPAGLPVSRLLALARCERTLPIVCRNLGIPCAEEREILARQIAARSQAGEILREIEALPLKGLHLAHRLYPSPGMRDMGDLDLLVRPGTLVDADRGLRRLGYDPECDPEALMRAGGPLGAVVYWREGSMPVHLHWRVSNASLPHFMYRIDEEEIWREARGGAMAPHHLVVTLCEHALKHSFDELIHLADLELAARGVDWGEAAAAARRWRLEGAVRFSLILLRDLMGVRSPGLDHVGREAPDAAGRWFVRLARLRRWNGLSALGLASLAGRERGRFVREALSPPCGEGLSTRTFGGRLRRAAEMIWAGVTS